MNQTALDFSRYPKNPAKYGTQVWQVFELICNRGEASMPDFLKIGIPEFRSRINELDKLLRPLGWMVRHRREPGIKYVFFSIIKIGERSEAA